MRFEQIILLHKSGNVIFEQPYVQGCSKLNSVLIHENFGNSVDALRSYFGLDTRFSGEKFLNSKEVFKKSINLELIGNDGMAPGFVYIQPKGAVFEKVANQFNDSFLQDMLAVEVYLPIVYKKCRKLGNLTDRFESTDQVFRVEDNKNELRLSYSADPNLLKWLENKTIFDNQLPLCIHSKLPAVRKFRSGSLNTMTTVRQYELTDIHTICRYDQAVDTLEKLMKHCSRDIRYWCRENWILSIDICEEFVARYQNLIGKLTKASEQHAVVNVVKNRTHYYGLRIGLQADVGSGTAMLYNFQLDEENPKNFNIKSDKSTEIVLIHSNGLTGSGLMTLFVGRLLSHKEQFPSIIASNQIAIIPRHKEDKELADQISRDLNSQNIRSIVVEKRRIGKSLAFAQQLGIPYYSIVGGDNSSIRIHKFGHYSDMDIELFLLKINSENSKFNINQLYYHQDKTLFAD
ncbi:hypothetical protein XBKQ1_2610006 [Xenorhabdus bovienii str. kraussei Quebec]|uniref:Anticodon-binding domain-containing protein n=1 Tax=Xenorhabdus bovienii str. kraussei Quebec TaxID=1398203 RepID=A0A077PI29_XENBV|nr:His/Gly/Thr/Pro-type tRNA ligase C-terminal domain-containing protein [Xenorhabdus bovienii]CDH20376.1 hypothetical protein XBKQ1_2610006 [Xenorhabdus bovienii str. kraussei Quebec]